MTVSVSESGTIDKTYSFIRLYNSEVDRVLLTQGGSVHD